MAEPAEQRFTHLDGLRGLACLMVLMSHYVICFYEAMLNGQAANAHALWQLRVSHSSLVIFYNPPLGVAIFFVLSGFVLAASVAQRRPPFWAMALRRWVRLCLPVLALTPLCYAALHLGAFRHTHAAALIAKTTWVGNFYTPLAYLIPFHKFFYAILVQFITNYGGVELQLMDSLWTLPIELTGSLMLFAFYYGCAYVRPDLFSRKLGCFAVAVLAVPLLWTTPYYGFGLGVALFEIRRGLALLPAGPRTALARRANWAGAAALLAGLWLGGTPFVPEGRHLALILAANRLGVPLGITDMQHAGAACLVAAAVLLRPFQTLLRTRPCQYLGRISFMLYVVQNPVECSLPLFVFLHTGPDYNYRALAALVAYLGLCWLIADLASRFIDQPSIHLSRRITKLDYRALFNRARQPLTPS